MRKWLTYCLLWLSTTICYSQSEGEWVFTPTTESAIFIFNKDFLRINQIFTQCEPGDRIGVFAQTGNDTTHYECVGFGEVPKGDTITVIAYGKVDSLGKSGFEEGKPYKLFYWDQVANCQFQIDKQCLPNTLRKGTYSKISNCSAQIPVVSYSDTSFFQSHGSILPSINPPLTNDRAYFYGDGSVSLDSSGRINLQQSMPGRYTIKFSTLFQSCLSTRTSLISDRLVITIKEDPKKADSLNIDSLAYSFLSPTCTKAGSLSISQKNVKGSKPFFFQLQHLSSERVYTSNTGNFDGLPSGIYKLEVTDSVGNMATYHLPIALLVSEDCTTNPVLTPDNRNGVQTLYISDVGLVKIFDRDGKTIRELSVPGEWDGTDGKSLPAPMGDYYLFLNGQQYKIVTILR